MRQRLLLGGSLAMIVGGMFLSFRGVDLDHRWLVGAGSGLIALGGSGIGAVRRGTARDNTGTEDIVR